MCQQNVLYYFLIIHYFKGSFSFDMLIVYDFKSSSGVWLKEEILYVQVG